ncbi:hypothetical protein TrLO_g11878 [Triparma laevis f. longispina]|uniref:Uncharacterized protein n=1 Tax=Triparma laevis f. longispina TaxID=1714387 RepID=A0A9W7L1K3_9STRA|nr:hypothetical protein TrLO_g11878 [Triparma laevis f. longispina]
MPPPQKNKLVKAGSAFDKETRIESMPRPKFSATFDNALLCCKLESGRDGVNGVLTKWFDPIKEHDSIVQDVEEKIDVSKALASVYSKEARTVKNWDAAWLIMNDRPEELEEYHALKKKNSLTGMLSKDKETYSEYYEGLKDPKMKVEAETDWKRFCTLNAKCERLIKMQVAVVLARETKMSAFTNSQAADKELEAAKDEEKASAARISNDHMVADEQRLAVAELFPTIQCGFIVTSVNGNECEDKDFSEIMNLIVENFPPHTLQFRRYDYRQDVAHGNWWSLQELRDQNKYVEDPRLTRGFFTETCRRGSMAEIELRLKRGADVNAYEAATGQSGLHLAASNAHLEVMGLLLKAGADLEARDSNMDTPLLLAARTGHISATEFLLQRRANVNARDSMGRNALIHAVKSKNLDLVTTMMVYNSDMNMRDKEWGWTPLHYAASSGSIEMCADIIDQGGNVYAVSTKGKSTALDVAVANEHEHVAEFLSEYIFAQPAQNITPTASTSAIWLGSQSAAYPLFSGARGFRGILSIFEGERNRKTLWLDDDPVDEKERIIYMKLFIPKGGKVEKIEGSKRNVLLGCLSTSLDVVKEGGEGEDGEAKKEPEAGDSLVVVHEDVDDGSADDWAILVSHLKAVLKFIDLCQAEKRTMLIHDDSGSNFATAFLVVWLCTRKKVRVNDALEHVRKFRREAVVSKGMMKGMKKFQDSLDSMKLKRLEKRLRNSDVVSIGF